MFFNLPQLDGTITISIVLGICALISPPITALINNTHHKKIRKMELEHEEMLRKLDLQYQTNLRQIDIYYVDKKTAFSEFMNAAGLYSMGKQSYTHYESLHATIDKALLFCNPTNQELLSDFLSYIDKDAFGGGYTPNERITYSKKVNEIAISLNDELDLTRPIIEYKYRKS